MRSRSFFLFASLLLIGLIVAFLYGCAHQVSPEGGPFDMTPPELVKATPPNGAVNVTKRTIKLRFNENVRLEKQSEKVTVAPPQLEPPRFTAGVGKTITIKIEEPLRPRTTYTFDFSDAIVDLNESNPLEGFVYAFSTGPHIDTMQLRGCLLNARTLMPLSAYTVGVYPDSLPDLPGEYPMVRIAKTTDNGTFTIANLPAGRYYLTATNDIDRNFCYSQTNEGIAFLTEPSEAKLPIVEKNTATSKVSPQSTDSIVPPIASEGITLNADSTALPADSAIVKADYEDIPDNLLLYALASHKIQALSKSSRPDSVRLELTFAEQLTECPELKPLFNYSANRSWVPQLSENGRTITYFLTDSLLYKRDTLDFALSFASVDSLSRPIVVADSVRFVYNRPKPVVTTSKRSAPSRQRTLQNKGDSLQTDSTILASDTLSLAHSELPAQPHLQVTLWREPGLYKGHPKAAVRLSFAEPIVLPDSLPIHLYSVAVDSAALASSTDSISSSLGTPSQEQPERPTPNPRERAYNAGAANPYESAVDKYASEEEAPARQPTSEPIPQSNAEEAIPEGERTPIPFSLEQDSLHGLDYRLVFDAQFGTQYLVEIDSASIQSLYRSTVHHELLPFATNREDQFGAVKLLFENREGFNPDGVSCYFELLDKADSVLLSRPVSDSLIITDLAPDTYFGRIWVDRNGNGVWDTGSFPSEQPEPTYYLPKAIALQPKFTTEISWNPLAVPLHKQRPNEMFHPEAEKKEERAERKNLNEEYVQRMRERYGERWNPGNRDRKILGMPSRKEAKAARKAERAAKKASSAPSN